VCQQLYTTEERNNSLKNKETNYTVKRIKIQQDSFMRNAKQHHSWKLDDERRKRSALSSSPIPTNNSPVNYVHEKIHSGTSY
jgi:hypothetical protein